MGAEPGPGGVAGAAALPGQGGQAGGAGELVEQAEATFWAGAVLQLVSLVMKSLFLSFTKQQKEVLQSPCSLPEYSLIVFSTKMHCSLV